MKIRTIAAAAVMALVMTGCGSDSSGIIQSASTAISNDSSYSQSYGGDLYYESSMESVVNEESSVNVQNSDRKLIKTVDMTVETEDYEGLIVLLTERVNALGGYLESFSTEGSSARYGRMKIRIPKQNLDAMLETVEGASNITYRNEQVEDVTLSYVDMESHKKMLLAEQERLLELLERAETIEDIITIESRLTDVRYQIESMESQLRTFDNQIDYSTIVLNIDEVVRYTPQEQKGAWERISTGFMENVYVVRDGLCDFFINFIIHIPNIILFLIIVVLLGLFVKLVLNIERKSSEKKRKKQEQERYQQWQQNNQNQQPRPMTAAPYQQPTQQTPPQQSMQPNQAPSENKDNK